jgi:hypothetical protein
MKKNLGIVLLVIGVVLLVLGMQEYGAFGSSVSRVFGRGPSDRAWALFVSGAICSGLGIIRIIR